MNSFKSNILKSSCLLTILMVSSFAFAADWSIKKAPLMTRWAADIDINNPLPEYPRPQMVRQEWVNLNGLWEFQVGTREDAAPYGKTLSEKILVPYPIESALSGVMEHHDRVWYRRMISIPSTWSGSKILLHFGAIDWESEIFINGKSVCIHKGGYDEISIDITPYLVDKKEQELIVRVFDPTESYGQPRGKQENPPHGNLIMYTPVTGIWQTVWMEPVSTCSIQSLKLIPDVDGNRLKMTVVTNGTAENVTVQATALDGEKLVATVSGNAGTELYIPIKKAKLWSPESPFLYNLNIELKSGETTLDRVGSYFGMRKVSIEQVGDHMKMFLNNKFTYNLGFLDQGFWPDGIYTAPTDEALRNEIQIQKDFGYNFIRKHIKVEPQRWYYWADKLGIMVWQDMPSANSYRNNPPAVDTLQYRKEMGRMIDGRINSPCITTWVLFNERQGQKDSDGNTLTQSLLNMVRAKDPSRLINVASDNTYYEYIGDILDFHSYPGPKAIESKTMATACGEFGSIGLAIPGHEWKANEGVSGLMVKSVKELEDIYEGYIKMLSEYKESHGMSGAVFTQLTDVEQEINGFLTYDRVSKVNIEKIKAINERLIYQTLKKEVLIPDATSTGLIWKYTTTKPASDWTNIGFDDAAWKSGKGGFGAGAPPESVVNTEWNTNDIWLRTDVKMSKIKPQDLENIYFHIYYDEDYEVYINGIQVASGKGNSTSYVSIPLTEGAKKALKSKKVNTIAVHCHQTSGGQYIDFGMVKVSY